MRGDRDASEIPARKVVVASRPAAVDGEGGVSGAVATVVVAVMPGVGDTGAVGVGEAAGRSVCPGAAGSSALSWTVGEDSDTTCMGKEQMMASQVLAGRGEERRR